MYDFFKLDISYLDFEILERNPLLNWLFLVDSHGEIAPMHLEFYKSRKRKPEKIALYKGLHFERYTHKDNEGNLLYSETFIKGSLHKFHNDGDHNANDYTLKHHKRVLRTLMNDFGVDPHLTRVNHIEVSTLFGKLKYPLKKIIGNVLVHNTKGAGPRRYNFLEMATSSFFKSAKRKQYICKCYSKSMQYNFTEGDIFRFEVKYSRMERLNKIGFYNLGQTIEPKFIKLLQEDLLQRWNETLMYDWTIDKSQLKQKQIIQLKDYCNHSFWMNINPEKRRYNLKNYRELVSRYSENVHQYIAERIKENSIRLIESTAEADSHNLTNSIVSTKGEKRKYPDYIYQYKPDDPIRKKLRNDKSNRMAQIERRYKALMRAYRQVDIVEEITEKDLDYFEDLKHTGKWFHLIRMIESHIKHQNHLKTIKERGQDKKNIHRKILAENITTFKVPH